MEVRGFPEFRDIGWRWIAYVTSAILLVLILFAFFYEVELKQDVRCEIVSSSEIKIQGYAGLISAIHVHPLQHVEPGTPLFQLTRDLSLSADGKPRQAFDAHLRDEQIQAATSQFNGRRADLDAQLRAARLSRGARTEEISALDAQRVETRQIIDEAQRKLDRLNAVAEYVAADRIEQASAEMLQGKVALAQTNQRRQQLIAESGTLRGTQAGLEAQIRELEAQHMRDLQDIQLRFEQLRQNVTISAPRSGVVTFSGVVQGRTLEASEVALVIDTEPAQPLIAALRIPSRQRGFVREGQIVRIKFDAFPYARFGSHDAVIQSISNTTIGAGEADASPSADPARPAAPRPAESHYMAWAKLDGRFMAGRNELKVLSGMSGTASIVVERRTIAEWVFEPLFRMMRG